MFVYEQDVKVTYPYDTSPLMVLCNVKVYIEEGEGENLTRTYLTEIPFPNFPFSEVQDKSTAGFNIYMNQKINDVTSSEEWQNKLNELKIAYDLGIYKPSIN